MIEIHIDCVWGRLRFKNLTTWTDYGLAYESDDLKHEDIWLAIGLQDDDEVRLQ